MLESASPLSQTALGSALGNQSMIRPTGNGAGRVMTASLMLTSLVDAFSILVIFLIMNNATSSEVVNIGEKIQLPTARESSMIENGVVVRIEKGQFLVDEKPVALSGLAAKLKSLNSSVDTARREGLIIVADRGLNYEELSPVILAGSSSGFTKFKFAILKK